jgi:hypothetical protein
MNQAETWWDEFDDTRTPDARRAEMEAALPVITKQQTATTGGQDVTLYAFPDGSVFDWEEPYLSVEQWFDVQLKMRASNG